MMLGNAKLIPKQKANNLMRSIIYRESNAANNEKEIQIRNKSETHRKVQYLLTAIRIQQVILGF